MDEQELSQIYVGKRDLSAENHWSELDQDYQIDKPVLLVLGGMGTECTKQANGNAKAITDLIGITDKDIDILSFYYKLREDDSTRLFRMFLDGLAGKNRIRAVEYQINRIGSLEKALEQKQGWTDIHYIKKLYKNFFEPLFSENNGTTKVSVSAAKKRCRNVNVVGHCHGAYVMSEVERMMQKKMQELGYSGNETKDILKQIVVFNIAPVHPLGNAKFSTYSFSSSGDTKECNLSEKTINKFMWRTAEQSHSPEESTKNYSDSTLKISDNEMFFYKKGGGIEFSTDIEHDIAFFTQCVDSEKNPMPYLLKSNLECALSNSVQNAQSAELVNLPNWQNMAVEEPLFEHTETQKGFSVDEYKKNAIVFLARGVEIKKKYQDFLAEQPKQVESHLLNEIRQKIY